jgi:hypothetical protein
MKFKSQLVISEIDNHHLAEMLMSEISSNCNTDVKTSYDNQELTITNVDASTMVDDCGETLLTDYLSKIVNKFNNWKTDGYPSAIADYAKFISNGGVVSKYNEIDPSTEYFTDAKRKMHVVNCFYMSRNMVESTCLETGIMHYFNMTEN